MGFIEYTYEKVVCGLMSEIEFKTSSHSSKIWILLLFICEIAYLLITVRTKETMGESLKKKREKKASSPTSLRVNTWIVFHSLYLESSCLHFFLFQSRSISSTFLFPSHISADAFPANLSLFLSVALNFRLAIRVTSLQCKSYTMIWVVLSWGLRGW